MSAFNVDEREMWDLTAPHEIEPSGDQTAEQALHFAVESFKHACWFDGVDPPDDDVVYAELGRLHGDSLVQRLHEGLGPTAR